MLMNVFYDLRFFLLFFAMVIEAMTVMLQILLKTTAIEEDDGEEAKSFYEGISTVAFYVLALR